MVVVAIMGTLAAIAIPAYNEYRKAAKKTAYKTDLNALHKGFLAFGVELDSFCERDTAPRPASITNIGMGSLISSKLYGQSSSAACTSTLLGAACTGCSLNTAGTDCTGTTASCTNTADNGQTCAGSAAYVPASIGPGKDNFIGFGQSACSGALAASTNFIEVVHDGASTTDTNCDLQIDSYEMGVAGHLSGEDYYGVSLNNIGVLSSENEGPASGTGTPFAAGGAGCS